MITSSYLKRTNNIQFLDKENEEILEEKRLNDLKNRFNNLGVTVEKTKRTKYEVLDEQMTKIDENISFLINDKSLTEIKTQSIELRNEFEDKHQDMDSIDNQSQKKTNIIVDGFRERLDEMRADNRGLLSEFSKQSTDRLFVLRMALNKNQKVFQDQLSEFSVKVHEELDEMRDKTEKEGDEREESATEIESTIMAELDRIEEEILIDRKVKDETSSKIKSLIEDLNNDIYMKVESEKQERETSNNSLLNLLEEACNRIEKSFSAY